MTKTCNLWNAMDDGTALVGIPTGGYDNSILIEVSEDTDDGTFPTLASYTRTINQIEDTGISAWINRWTRKKSKLEIDLGDYKIIREDKYSTTAILEFKEPITIWHTQVGETPVTSKVKRIEGELFHDYYFTRNGRQNKIANGFEVWFSMTKYLG